MSKKRAISSYFDPAIECIAPSLLAEIQLQKLQATLQHAADHSPFYKKKLKQIALGKVKSLTDFSKLPLTTKQELLTIGPYGNLAVPTEKVIEVHFSSGTTKKPVPSYFTRQDIKISSKTLARTWYMQGVRPETIFGMLASYGLFSAGMINHNAIQHIGAFIIPISSSPTSKTLQLMKDFRVTALAAVASYYLYLIHKMKTVGLEAADLALSHGIAGGEPFTPKQRRFVERQLGITLFDQYGLCEIETGLAGECAAQNGLHLLSDHAYPEIIDPKTGRVLPVGEEGELVLTTLNKQASPLIRYRTGDITSLITDPCSCGRTHPRIAKIKGRILGTIFYKGVKIERDFVEKIIDQTKTIDHFIWQFILTGTMTNQAIELKVVPKDAIDPKLISSELKSLFRDKIGVQISVSPFSLVELDRIQQGKLKHFVDLRKEA